MPMDVARVVDPYKPEWVAMLFLIVVAALAWTNVNSPRKWRLLAQAAFRMRLGKQVLREEAALRDRTFLGLVLVAMAVLSLFLWQRLGADQGLAGYATLASMACLLVLAHIVIVEVLSWLFQADGGLHEHLTTGLLLLILTGMVLLPITMLVAYRPDQRPLLLILGTVLILVLVVYRWVRGLWIGLSEQVPLRYIILYLCAAEAVPLAFLWRSLIVPLSAHPHP